MRTYDSACRPVVVLTRLQVNPNPGSYELVDSGNVCEVLGAVTPFPPVTPRTPPVRAHLRLLRLRTRGASQLRQRPPSLHASGLAAEVPHLLRPLRFRIGEALVLVAPVCESRNRPQEGDRNRRTAVLSLPALRQFLFRHPSTTIRRARPLA